MAAFWVIGDIHGMLDPLHFLLKQIYLFELSHNRTENLEKSTKIIFLGDYIDHGPNSKQVIDLLLTLKDSWDKEFVFLAGNHEDMFLHFYHQTEIYQMDPGLWFYNGAQTTLMSFFDSPDYFDSILDITYQKNINSPSVLNSIFAAVTDLDQKYIDFFNNLKYAHSEQITVNGRLHNLAFFHAGYAAVDDFDIFEPTYATLTKKQIQEQLKPRNFFEYNEFRKEKKLDLNMDNVWSREYFGQKLFNYILIHGHTPTKFIWNTFKLQEFDLTHPAITFGKGQFYNFNSPKKYGFDQLSCINLDTGAVYGGALTAMYFSEDLLNLSGEIILMQVITSKGYRTGNLQTRRIKFKI